MQQVFLKTCVAAVPRLLFLALLASACETPRDDLGPALERDGGDAPAGPVRGGAGAGEVDATGSNVVPPDVLPDAPPPDQLPPGSCTPGARRCGGDGAPELCTADGIWMAAAACPFVCQGPGVCAGVCKPGDKRCSGPEQLTTEACDESGRWVAGARCQNLCQSGSCSGSCMPGARRCGGNQRPELCSNIGAWQPEAACPFVCTGAGVCGGQCKPGQLACNGSNLRTCGADATWASEACPVRPNATAVCRNNSCDFDCTDPKFPHRCGNACCECRQPTDCPEMPDSTVSCSAGRCAYQAMCDLGRRTWNMASTSPCGTSSWRFVRRADGRWDASETGCGNATGVASYDGTTIRLDFTYFEGAGRYVWPVDNRCVGRPGTLTFTAGPGTGMMYESTLTVAP